MRTDGSFHGSFTLAPRPAAWSLMRPGATDEHGFYRMRRVVCMGECHMTGPALYAFKQARPEGGRSP